MYVVYKERNGRRIDLRVFEHEIDAMDYIDCHDCKVEDEYGNLWMLDYRET